ncbi:MAG: periplasmic heavy metal sensor [Ancalomicrobiaceae bacterium]|nr:periplasmic heavy metal sensor [Ancalomicrobiaceae bacterium]
MSERGFRWLVVSLLVLNVFLLGALLGGGVTWITSSAKPLARLPLAGELLPQKDRVELTKALAETRRAARDTVLEGRQAQIDAASLLGQPTLDPSALSTALERARNAELAVRAAVEQRAVEVAASLPLDARRRLAEGLLQRFVPRPPAAK